MREVWHGCGMATVADVNGDEIDDILCFFTTSGIYLALSKKGEKHKFKKVPTNYSSFIEWALSVRPVVGNFYDDPHNPKGEEIILIGGKGWDSLPIAVFKENQNIFHIENRKIDSEMYAIHADYAFHGIQTFVGDFDGSGLDDVIFLSKHHWKSIPTMYSQGGGKFRIVKFQEVPFHSELHRLISKGSIYEVYDADGESGDDIVIWHLGDDGLTNKILSGKPEGKHVLK